MACIRFDRVTKRYGSVLAVDALELEIRDREFVVLLGPSGCGKTTTLNMIAGLEELSAGDVYFDDEVVTFVPPHKRDVAMVFQSYALYPHKSVRDNIAFGLKMRGHPAAEIEQRVRDAAERLRIAELLERKPSQLSGGQRQRVALGRAIVRQPAVFLMDEPLSNLDAALRVSTRAEIKALHQSMRTTFVYVTHDQAEALTLADRIVVMRDGIVQQTGTPDDIYERPHNTFVASFLGNPPINYLAGALDRSNGAVAVRCGADFVATLPTGLAAKLSDAASGEVLLGIRPEDVTGAAPASGDGVIVGRVGAILPSGSDQYLEIRVGDAGCFFRVDKKAQYRSGEVAFLAFDPARLHLFDKASGRSLLYGG
jgi:multiple sugar transport system ATP-binding protein